MPTRTHVLISEGFNLGVSIGGSTNKLQPPNRVDWSTMYDELRWTITLLGITDGGTPGNPTSGGSFPTAFTLSARFEARQMHSVGDTARFQTPKWWHLTEDEAINYTAEGRRLQGPGQLPPPVDPITDVGDSVLCTHLTTGYQSSGAGVKGLFTNPIRITRTFTTIPPGLRLVIPTSGSSFTGGVDPRFLIGLEVTGTTNGKDH